MAQMGEYIGAMFSIENGLLSEAATPLVLGYLPLIAVGWFMSMPIARKMILKIFSCEIGIFFSLSLFFRNKFIMSNLHNAFYAFSPSFILPQYGIRFHSLYINKIAFTVR